MKKEIKRLKRDIVEHSAIQQGYLCKVIREIPEYALIEAIKVIALHGWINYQTDTSEISNMLVTESVKAMGYQDFKKIARNFFGNNLS